MGFKRACEVELSTNLIWLTGPAAPIVAASGVEKTCDFNAASRWWGNLFSWNILDPTKLVFNGDEEVNVDILSRVTFVRTGAGGVTERYVSVWKKNAVTDHTTVNVWPYPPVNGLSQDHEMMRFTRKMEPGQSWTLHGTQFSGVGMDITFCTLQVRAIGIVPAQPVYFP